MHIYKKGENEECSKKDKTHKSCDCVKSAYAYTAFYFFDSTNRIEKAFFVGIFFFLSYFMSILVRLQRYW